MVKCIAPGCTSGYQSNSEKCHFFSVPKDEQLSPLWQKALLRKDFTVKPGQSVCEKHFHNDDILREKILKGPDGTILGKSPYGCLRLRKGALPSIFPGCPSYLSKQTPKSRKPPRKRSLEIVDESSANTITKRKCVKNLTYENNNYFPQSPESSQHNPELLFASIWDKIDFSIPTSWSQQKISSNGINMIQFSDWIVRKKDDDFETVCSKQITLDKSMNICIKIMGTKMNVKDFGLKTNALFSVQEVEDVIKTVNEAKICTGCAEINAEENIITSFTRRDKEGYLRHQSCPLILSSKDENDFQKKTDKCKFCARAKYTLNQKIVRIKKRKENAIKYLKLQNLSPERKRQIKYLQIKLQTETRAKIRAKQRILILKKEMESCRETLSKTDTEALNKILDKKENISKNERTVISEIFSAAGKKNPKNNRFSDDWIILCLLLHMRSPVAYRMLRDSKILPLPCTRTVRRYLAQIDIPCGFDPNFFQVLEKYFENKSDEERDGILLIDEMKTRKGLLLDQTTMKYKGLSDFETEQKPMDITENMADHGLVFAFRPLNDNYTQPIAVFASKGPVIGDVLTKLVIEAICCLEKVGARVHGLVTDAAATNRRIWTNLGCSGKLSEVKNSIVHPTDEKREFFFFSDTPHLIKNVRNCLANRKILQVDPSDNAIEWECFIILHNLDKLQPACNRRCPKISDAHINAANDSLTKMRVSFAVQILSKSVANGLRFYRAYEPRLKNSESTSKFCEIFNDLFDALNRTSTDTGLRLGCDDFKALENSLKWLDEWETRVKNGEIKPEEFLTDSTAVGIRMTIHSTISLANYLLKVRKYKEVLTGKINQDPLERFFGTIRLAGGTNDHPATPTFLQIYKILAFYSVLKPPATGNCKIDPQAPTEPLLPISELQEIYKTKEKEDFLKIIESKLNNVILDEDADFSDFTDAADHDYDLPYVVDCLIYFITGQVCERIKKRNCENCNSSLFSDRSEIQKNHPIAKIITYDENNELRHPNLRLFLFLKTIENSFAVHCKMSNVFDLVVNEIANQKINFITCNEHGKETIAYIILYYLQYRMRQFSKIYLSDKKKANLQKKKAAKLAEY